MITEACILIGGAVGAIVGAAVGSTEKGQKLNSILNIG
jgi:gas vesicle protein